LIFWVLAFIFYVGFMRYLVLPNDLGPGDWNYVYEKTAPPAWYSLSEDYALCGNGTAQSPINIVDAVVTAPDQSGSGESGSADLSIGDIFNHTTGTFLAEAEFLHGPKYICQDVNTTDPNSGEISCGTLRWESDLFFLTEMTFHGPAETSRNGTRHGLEAQLLHVSPTTGREAILAVSYATLLRTNSTALNPLWWGQLNATSDLAQDDRTIENFQINALYSDSSGFYLYPGSRTVPPCRENVLWFVSKAVEICSLDQIDAFHASTVGWGGNSRPIQPRNGRSVVSYGRDGFYAVKSDFLDLYNQCTGLARTFDELLEA